MGYSFVIITGMSGAGKTLAVKSLEDVGYFCIDNMPTPLILNMLEDRKNILPRNPKIACVIDIRNGEEFNLLSDYITKLQKEGIAKIIYLDSNEKVLIDRYKETRRKHPLMFTTNMSLEESVKYERQSLTKLYVQSDFVLDTSLFSTSQLKNRLLSFVLNDEKQVMSIDVISFGFKFGVPADADLLFDVRCLLNPFYIPELKKLTGNDEKVRDFVLSQDDAQKLLKCQKDLIDLSLPLYIKEGKSHLTIAYGCTGGKHRSISFANEMYKHIKNQGYTVNVHHRDELRGK